METGNSEHVEISSIKRWSEYWNTLAMYAKFPQLKLFNRMSGLNISFPTLWFGDITLLQVDVIVNAAHRGLTGGGGVDGYIHSRAGEQLFEECLKLNGCEPGEAKMTSSYKLPSKYVIHTVGPFGENEEILKNCYLNCLNLAIQNGLKTIAFPCISTGHYQYPIINATLVVLKTIRDWLEINNHSDDIELVIFCVNKVEAEVVYEEYMPNFFPA